MHSQVFSADSPPSPEFLTQLATSLLVDEIANEPGAVRRYIFGHGDRDKSTGKLKKAILFAVFQVDRYSPQTGFRLCLIHEGYYIASRTKNEGDPEDEIDQIEKEIPRGHSEYVILGENKHSEVPAEYKEAK